MSGFKSKMPQPNDLKFGSRVDKDKATNIEELSFFWFENFNGVKIVF